MDSYDSRTRLTASQSVGCRLLHERFKLRGTMLAVWINAPAPARNQVDGHHGEDRRGRASSIHSGNAPSRGKSFADSAKKPSHKLPLALTVHGGIAGTELKRRSAVILSFTGNTPGVDLQALHVDVARRFDSDADTVPADRHDHDSDLVCDNDFFSDSAR
jgi:hypothetical protein